MNGIAWIGREKILRLRTQSEYYITNVRYYSMIYDEPVNNMLLAAGTEVVKDQNEKRDPSEKKEERNIVREIRTVVSNTQKESHQHIHDMGSQKLTQLCFIKSLYNQCGIIGGTEYGQIKIFSYIFN